MKALLTLVFTVLFVFAVIFWGSLVEARFQYNTLEQIYARNMECRVSIATDNHSTIEYVEKVCGPVPTWDPVAYNGVEG